MKSNFTLEQLHHETRELALLLETSTRRIETPSAKNMRTYGTHRARCHPFKYATSSPPSHDLIDLDFKHKDSMLEAIINTAKYTYMFLDAQKAMTLIDHALMTSLGEQKPKRFHLFHLKVDPAAELKCFKIFLENCIKADNDAIEAQPRAALSGRNS
ncbi:MAG: hypothetical protein H0W64_02275 [Gammaproteobacteria bacterium]|nr:hypothetical protein [Gammaproteobacteria bacterium]